MMIRSAQVVVNFPLPLLISNLPPLINQITSKMNVVEKRKFTAHVKNGLKFLDSASTEKSLYFAALRLL